MALRAGKGVRLPLDAEFTTWLLSVHGQINQAFEWANAIHGQQGTRAADAIEGAVVKYLIDKCKWEYESNDYGVSANKGFEGSKDMFYVTVLINLRGNLQLDYRTWYEEA